MKIEKEKKTKRRSPYIDTHGIPLPIDYILMKSKEDLVYQVSPRKNYYDKLILNPLLIEVALDKVVSDHAFRIFCYIGGGIVHTNISYINSRTLMDRVGIKRSAYSLATNELLKKGFIREIGSKEGFTPTCKSDRIFLVSPAYFWHGTESGRKTGVKRWYGARR